MSSAKSGALYSIRTQTPELSLLSYTYLPHLSVLTPMGLKLLLSFQFLLKLFSRKFLSNFSVLEILHFYISTYGMRVGKIEEGNSDKEWGHKTRMKPSEDLRKCSRHLLALPQSVTTQRLHEADFPHLFPWLLWRPLPTAGTHGKDKHDHCCLSLTLEGRTVTATFTVCHRESCRHSGHTLPFSPGAETASQELKV